MLIPFRTNLRSNNMRSRFFCFFQPSLITSGFIKTDQENSDSSRTIIHTFDVNIGTSSRYPSCPSGSAFQILPCSVFTASVSIHPLSLSPPEGNLLQYFYKKFLDLSSYSSDGPPLLHSGIKLSALHCHFSRFWKWFSFRWCWCKICSSFHSMSIGFVNIIYHHASTKAFFCSSGILYIESLFLPFRP